MECAFPKARTSPFCPKNEPSVLCRCYPYQRRSAVFQHLAACRQFHIRRRPLDYLPGHLAFSVVVKSAVHADSPDRKPAEDDRDHPKCNRQHRSQRAARQQLTRCRGRSASAEGREQERVYHALGHPVFVIRFHANFNSLLSRNDSDPRFRRMMIAAHLGKACRFQRRFNLFCRIAFHPVDDALVFLPCIIRAV